MPQKQVQQPLGKKTSSAFPELFRPPPSPSDNFLLYYIIYLPSKSLPTWIYLCSGQLNLFVQDTVRQGLGGDEVETWWEFKIVSGWVGLCFQN